MTRKLPWLSKDISSKTASTKSAKSSIPTKRVRLVEPTTSDTEVSTIKGLQERASGHDTFTSKARDPPEEQFMIEGLENDDKFRMVEDEFMDVAKSFTQHLHAQEYKRMMEVARRQNVDTMRPIARPVTQSMPDATKRKVEGVARAKQHANTVASLLGKTTGDESSSDEGSAWIGTCLHGLMDSPKKRAANLTTIRPILATTRAAAGFRKSRASINSVRPVSPTSPSKPRIIPRKQVRLPDEYAAKNEDEEDDDDLDAPSSNVARRPIPVPKPVVKVETTVVSTPSQASLDHAAEVARRVELRRQARLRK